MMHKILIAVLFLLTTLPAAAKFDFNNNCHRAYEEMMLFKFDAAQKILDSEKQLHPDNVVSQYIEAYILFWKAALNENEEEMDEYESFTDNVIDLIEDDEQVSPYKLYFLSDMYLRGAYLKVIKKSYLAAVYRFNKAYNMAWENRKKYPDFIPNKKLIGLMNVGIGTVPKNYNWVLKLFDFEGNIQQGLTELNQLLVVASFEPKYHYLLSESLLLYSFTMLNFEVSKESEQNLLAIFKWDAIQEQMKHNQFMVLAKASFLKHIKQNDQAIACMQNLKPESASMHFYYLDYMLGECMLYKLDYGAAKHLKYYVDHYHGLSYRRSACQKLAWVNLLQGNTQAYKTTMAACLSLGDDNRDSDKQATKEAEAAKEGIVPNVTLIKARLLFDGGYFARAEQVLLAADTKNFNEHDQLEYSYRLGRIYDEWGKTKQAIAKYRYCIATGKDTPYYFAANSALHLGYIYENQGDTVMAQTLYRQCLDMDFEEYQNSITQKAKAALGRLEKD